jgi:hypothetical protein
MPIDSRLTDVSLLTLAAFRVQRRRQRAVPDWRQSVGLSSLLAAARSLPQRGPWELPALEAGGSMGQLLKEARQWQEDRRGA